MHFFLQYKVQGDIITITVFLEVKFCLSIKTSVDRSLFNFKKFFPLLKNLVAKDFKVKYRRSFLGVAWSVLNPLLTMLVLTQVFSLLLRVGSVENFASYYIVGSALWTFFSEATSNSLSSILGASALIKKVYIPKYIFPLEKCIFSLVNFLFSLIAVALVVLVQDYTQFSFFSLLFPIPVLYCFVFTAGLCFFLSAVTVYFRDVAHLYGVLLTMWIYLTPILYPMSIFDNINVSATFSRFIKIVVTFNPMTHYVQYFRDVVIYHTIPGLRENLICMAISLGTLFIGALVFKKAQDKFILHI